MIPRFGSMSFSQSKRSSVPSERGTDHRNGGSGGGDDDDGGGDDNDEDGGDDGVSPEPPLAPASIRQDPVGMMPACGRSSVRSSPLVFVRRAVSRRKRRFVEGEFDLDLSYITPRLVAMSFPSPTAPESLFRNPMGPTRRFLDERHADRYLVFNLADERRYDASEFHGRVLEFPFDDHAPPPLDTLCALCSAAHAYLRAERSNVLVVHCKAGKGRTGVMCCAVLLCMGEFGSAHDALAWYGYARAHNGKGVTIPSQRRYVDYAEQLHKRSLLIASQAPHPPRLLLRQLALSAVPGGLTLSSGLYAVVGPLRAPTTADGAVNVCRVDSLGAADWPLGALLDTPVHGDVRVQIFAGHPRAGGQRLLRFCVHTAFVPTDEPFVLPKAKLDDANKDDRHFPADFRVRASFIALAASA
mmetsp:Transcript_16804/g.43479  ORF Transcript_16804/g.43479 Transcript_16804/m.43479 type:complete len:413 (-) Transcript_16804:76-1314(-)